VDLPAWLERAAPTELGAFLGTTASPRKAGLFIRHLCRCFPDLFGDPGVRAALDADDKYEGGELDRDGFEAAVQEAVEARARAREAADAAAGGPRGVRWTADAAAFAAWIAHEVATRGYFRHALDEIRRAVLHRAGRGFAPRKNPIAPVMRPVFFEHFGDSRNPVAADPGWLTADVVALARGIYDERAFDRLPVLADALQDAGCDHPDVLAHCRGPGPHVRGCWVVDLLLGKQ
jgi:hypothetical protein